MSEYDNWTILLDFENKTIPWLLKKVHNEHT